MANRSSNAAKIERISKIPFCGRELIAQSCEATYNYPPLIIDKERITQVPAYTARGFFHHHDKKTRHCAGYSGGEPEPLMICAKLTSEPTGKNCTTGSLQAIVLAIRHFAPLRAFHFGNVGNLRKRSPAGFGKSEFPEFYRKPLVVITVQTQ